VCSLFSLSRTHNVNFVVCCATRMALIYLCVCVYPLHARFARGMLPFVNNSRHRTLTAGWLQAPRHAEKRAHRQPANAHISWNFVIGANASICPRTIMFTMNSGSY
jgi:hypothetical protein